METSAGSNFERIVRVKVEVDRLVIHRRGTAMPIAYSIDPIKQLVTTRLWGVTTDDDVSSATCTARRGGWGSTNRQVPTEILQVPTELNGREVPETQGAWCQVNTPRLYCWRSERIQV